MESQNTDLDFKKNITVTNSIIRIMGVFEHSNSKHFNRDLVQNGFVRENNEESKKFLKNYWYPEFRDLMFLQKEDSSAKIWKKSINKKVVIDNRKNITFEVDLVELFLFPNGLNFFSLEISIQESNLESYSDLTNVIRNFDSKVKSESIDYKWVNWIEENCLLGIKIEDVDVDEYSGSKFKLFSIYEINENVIDSSTRDELLYDLGCVSPIGSAGGNGNFSPDERYYYQLLEDKISVFKNYEILPLFDSFTCLGTKFLDKDVNSFKRKTWSDTYFRIVLYNLFLKYNLFRYNSKMNNNSSVKLRNEFEDFLNTYNITHIAYNFLPNMIAEKHRESLQIDNELEKFQTRINRISQDVQEKEQKRSNLLLTFVGIVTSLGSAKPLIAFIETFRVENKLNVSLFYSLLSILLIGISIPLLHFLFPDNLKSSIQKWKKKQK
jgi:hypothetical protein